MCKSTSVHAIHLSISMLSFCVADANSGYEYSGSEDEDDEEEQPGGR